MKSSVPALDVLDDAAEVGGEERGGDAFENGEKSDNHEGVIPGVAREAAGVIPEEREGEDGTDEVAEGGDGGDDEVDAVFHFRGDGGGPEAVDCFAIHFAPQRLRGTETTTTTTMLNPKARRLEG